MGSQQSRLQSRYPTMQNFSGATARRERGEAFRGSSRTLRDWLEPATKKTTNMRGGKAGLRDSLKRANSSVEPLQRLTPSKLAGRILNNLMIVAAKP